MVGNIIQWYGAPITMIAISVIYFLADSRKNELSARLLTSSHGILGAFIYLGAMCLHYFKPLEYRPHLAVPFAILCMVPLVAMFYSFFTFRGNRMVHILQILNLWALTWTLFIGGMAVTGDWI